MILTLLPGLVLLTAVVWRLWPGPAGFLASGLVLLLTLRIAVMRVPAAWLLFCGAALGAGISVAGSLPFLWPCELTCAGGEAWQQWRGVPLTLGGGASLAVLAVTSLWDARRRRLGLVTQALGWANVGASVYFLGLAASLRMACGHCLSVHTAVLSLLAVLGTSRRRWIGGLPLAALVAVVIHLGYAPVRASLGPADPTRDPTPGGAGGTDPAGLSPEAKDFLARAEAGRRVGSDQAPLRVEIVQAFTCSHCARFHAPTLGLLKELCDQGQVQLIWRHHVPWSQEEGPRMLGLALAAAASGEYEAFLADAFDAQGDRVPDANWRDGPTMRLLRALDRRRDLGPLEATRQEFAAVLGPVIEAEKARVRELGATGELPHAFVIDARTGEILKQWGGDGFEPYEVRQFVLLEAARR